MKKLPLNTSALLEADVRKFVGLARQNFTAACAFAFARSKNENYRVIIQSIFPELEGLDYQSATIVFKQLIDEIANNPREYQREFLNVNKKIFPSYFYRRDEIVE